ncbi:hypothetical protein [Geomicrobium sp. JCM 19039]|uniref:hypothetical protein n=1 Tax=Geomicrobium sp. JCM 19039 TaxID=1460636 RepID=UPI00045F3DD0|nr:hypothetical protein [Geomicrobium sp. JCM 19039]GAK13383.1 hypothetical protein JCM19039_3226 [Geomicrobium sp. JCM 19039]
MTSTFKEQPLDDQQQEILEKYDTESRFRSFKNKWLVLIVTIIAVTFSLYHLITAFTGHQYTYLSTAPFTFQRCLYLSFCYFQQQKKQVAKLAVV